MAVSAHSSLLSFLHLLDHIQHPSLHWLQLDQERIKSGHKMVTFLLDFLHYYDSHHCDSQVIEGLMGEIIEAVDEPEAMINLHVVDQLRNGWEDRSADLSCLRQEINIAVHRIASIKNEIMLAKEEWLHPEPSSLPAPAASRGFPPPGKSRMVGFDEHLCRIADQLTGDESGLQIITITGMGGTGKTTLATNVFEHRNIVRHFDRRIWVTISQEYDLHHILRTILSDLGNRVVYGLSLIELGDRLHKSLFGRRYLIVMDDIWSIEACEDLKKFFPDYENRSRVLVTTRSSNVAIHIDSHDPYPIGFLDEHYSWKLFCETVFIAEDCPCELVDIGKFIVKSCRGLPLAIAVVGALLAKSSMKLEFWEFVAKDVNSFANSADDEHCFNILSLSYTNLPIHLKPCFLYLGRFPEDQEIGVSKIVRMWVAEGFVRTARAKSLEQVAKEYLEDLVGRNMVIIRRWGSRGNVKSFIIHDLLRDFCRRRSREESFMHTPRVQIITKRQHGLILCFHCGNGRGSYANIKLQTVGLALDSSKSFRSEYVCSQCISTYPRLRRVRVIDMFYQSAGSHQYLLSTELSYLQIGDYNEFDSPCLIHLLWRLQALIITGRMYHRIPFEILELPHLRHLDTGKYISLPGFEDVEVKTKEIVVLENLHTVMCGEFRLTDDMLKRTPNLRKLKTWYEVYELPNFSNICRLKQLEVLDLRHLLFFNPIIPESVKKLSLVDCQLVSEDLLIIGLLPNLEVLYLNLDVEDFEWYPVARGGFLHLKVLEICGSWLTVWEAEANQFPKLEMLRLNHIKLLKEIPSGIGDIDTLHSIHMERVNDSLVNSIKGIVEEQWKLGNESIRVFLNEKEIQFGEPLD